MTTFVSILLTLVLSSCFLLVPWPARAADLLFQERDGASVQVLTESQISELNDPFFKLVLKDNLDATDLEAVEDLIQPAISRRQTFVVDEHIASSKLHQTRRSVLVYGGSNKGETIIPGHVMLSVVFSSDSFPASPSIEAMGWDQGRRRFNYYKLDSTGGSGLSWKFRGSSLGADQLSTSERHGTCMACHINGGPVMKELLLPWNNWQSNRDGHEYLIPGKPNSWPVSTTPFLNGRLRGAETLELIILDRVNDFNRARIELGISELQSSPSKQVKNAKQLLSPLFKTSEYNLISSGAKSGLDPFQDNNKSGPSGDIRIPTSFFLNQRIISGGGVTGYQGLGILGSSEFETASQMSFDEYMRVVNDSKLTIGDNEGDARFAWLVPEASHIDNSMINLLIQEGVVTPQFAAAALAVDLEHSVFSKQRESLLEFIPERFNYEPLRPEEEPLKVNRHPDGLTQLVIANLESVSPSPNSAAKIFLDRLRASDPIGLLQKDVDTAVRRFSDNMDKDDPATRALEIQALMDRANEIRRTALTDPVLSRLDESEGLLLPLPR